MSRLLGTGAAAALAGLVLLDPSDCARLWLICHTPTTGQATPDWCANGNLESWCPTRDPGVAVNAPEQAPDLAVVVGGNTYSHPECEPPLERACASGECRCVEPPPAPEPPRTEKPDVLEVRCSPPFGLPGYTARLFFRIDRPAKLYCPKVTIRWPGGLESVREADCEPLEEGEEAPPWSSGDLWPDGIRFRVYGAMEIQVEARVGKTVRRASCKVEGEE